MSSTIKNILIFILILAAVGGGYYYFAGNSADTPALTAVSTSGSVASDGDTGVEDAFLSTLLNIRNLQLDDSIFSSSAFRSLQDFTTELVDPGNEGRVNPFAPIGSDAVPSSSASVVPANTSAAPSATVKP